MSETYAIELKNITKRFGKVTANDKVCLSVKKGEILSILGENGSAVVEDWDLSGKIVKAFSEEEKEKRLLLKTLEEAEGNRARTARMLGISRTSLYEKLKKYRII